MKFSLHIYHTLLCICYQGFKPGVWVAHWQENRFAWSTWSICAVFHAQHFNILYTIHFYHNT